jgi:hypothetical protein
MSDFHPRKTPWPIVDGIRRWWLHWRGASSSVSELDCCGAYEVERLARDAGMTVSELRQLAGRGPEAADFLMRRMAALDLDRNEIAATEPRMFQDLQRVCTLCESRRRCARDLTHDPADQTWEDYCPNVATLKLLNALPWAARREW